MMDDDDLFVSPTTNEPMAFEFQSDLSDDDDDPVDDTFPSETPPLVSSDQTQDLPDRDPAQDPPLQTEPESESIQEQIEAQIAATTEAIEVGDVSDMLVAPTSPSASVVENGVSSDTSERTANGNSTGESNPSKTNNIEIQLPWMSPTKRAEFVHVEVVDKGYVAPNEPAFDDYDYMAMLESRKRKRRGGDDEAYDGFDDELDSGDEYEAFQRRSARQKSLTNYGFDSGRRSTRTSTRASSILFSSGDEKGKASRSLRPRRELPNLQQNIDLDDDKDELQDSDDNGDFTFIQSDIVQTKGRKKLRKLSSRVKTSSNARVTSDVDFAENRRSQRANKNTRNMAVNYAEDDDDIFYMEEVRTPGAPKISSMREIFQPPTSVDFKEAHRRMCDTCGNAENPNKGALIPCQGCSNMYHKGCLGPRSMREQCVTKVAADSFVLQCRFCLSNYKKKDERAPAHDVCQGCHVKGASCAAFSQKKTPKQEEKLRLENDGVDPITPVSPDLINNPDNVLFRCGRCRRGWHYEHLPHPTSSRDPSINDPSNLCKYRRDEYQITWQCKDCQDTEEEKIDKIVAWRPTNRDSYTKGQTILDFTEDEIEYLLKWVDKSYAHCVWMPGAWVFGIAKAKMRQAFVKRSLGEGIETDTQEEDGWSDSLLRWTEKEAIYDVWVTPDIILDVHYAPRTTDAEKRYKSMSLEDRFEYDLNRIFHVVKILVKFEGLGYEDAVWDTPPSSDNKNLYAAYLDAYREFLNGKHFKSEPWKNMKERVEHFRTLEFSTGIEVKKQPSGLQRGKLMGYQLEGLNWMLYNFRHKRSVILADEMGLGKTVQVVALLSTFIQDNPRVWPFLIVVPNSTCPNWRREIKKWAPDLRVVAYYGGRVSQALALRYELFPNNTRDMKAHVVIMSYDSVKDTDTRSRFSSVKWAGLIVDEAQALKNDENTLYKALSTLQIDFKLLLTGTPLQNNKRELFNLLQFVDTSLKAERLDEEFGEITKENLPKLHELIRPYFLRRTKAQVLGFLPPMAQIILPVSMSVLQERLCKSIMERNPQLIRSIFARGKLKASERGSLSNILMQLRKCLCHPFIYSQAIEDRNASPEMARRNLIEASSKLMLLNIMLPKLKERGHRVLIFSQFLEQLTILEDFLTGLELRHERLDGSQSSMEKQKKIDAFNAPDSNIFAMLLSTRAGGVGINLATADTVIILDPDWNPHQDIQALSRAHRIGQKKKVLCFQIMTVDSAEEKMLQIGRKKMALDHLLIESMDDKDGEATNDVESVLKHGAAALFGQGRKKEAITYDSASVDKLLDRSMEEETKMDGDKSAESAFALARVWAQDEGGLTEEVKAPSTEDEPLALSVWDKILKERDEEAKREAEKEMERLGRGGRRRGAANYTGQKFDFDKDQDEAAAGSDQESVDGDFVGNNESEAGSSEDDGEFTIGSNRKQARASQESDAQNSANPSKPKQGDSRSQTPKGLGGKITIEIPVPKSRSSSNPNQVPKKGSAKASTPTAIGNFLSNRAGVTGAIPTPASGLPNLSGAIPDRRGSAGPVVGYTAGAVQPGTSPHFNQIPPPSRAAGKKASNGILGSNNVAAAAAGNRATSASTAHLDDVTIRIVEGSKMGLYICFVCGYNHPPEWVCPEMTKEIPLRLAMDRLRLLPDHGTAVTNQRRLFLQERLRVVKMQTIQAQQQQQQQQQQQRAVGFQQQRPVQQQGAVVNGNATMQNKGVANVNGKGAAR